MNYLQTQFSVPATPVTRFLSKYEPRDLKEAKEFRAAFISAINHYLPNDGRWRVSENPDSMYLEEPTP